ncbi:class I SAM-dependent methyltransferase [Pontitalea aquivivens]|uniref:class I SAM-dependent methyltransferase n=1 Tax=Pontitalea aquivivens TaxID=3388663 RepID=UPI003970DE9C
MFDMDAKVLTDTAGQKNLPRWFARVFAVAGRGVAHGQLDFVLPDGRRFRIRAAAPGPQAEVVVHDPDIFARLIREGDLGFCEAYLDGGWSSPDLMAFMDLIHADNDDLYDGFPGLGLLRKYEAFRHWLRGNSRAQARRNIAAHYDLGNDFYALWLDPSMTYSSALYRGTDDLQEAQRQKYAAMVDALDVAPGAHVLEIGCGWGGFAEYAAGERGLRLTCLTISQAQHDYAVARIARAGLAGRVEIRLQDYRDTTGQFDAIASIEMFEAVGEKYWPTCFDVVHDRLRPGGKACLQVITVQEKRFQIYRQSPDFIQKYIFPGGMLPPPSKMQSLPQAAGLRPLGGLSFGRDYARTLRVWYERFNARWPEIAAMGFDARFRRMWNFYLASCAGAFEYGNCDVTQFRYERPGG